MPRSASGAAGQPHTVWATRRGVDHRPAPRTPTRGRDTGRPVLCQHVRCRRRRGAAVGRPREVRVWPREGTRALAMFTATKTVVRFVLATNSAPQVTKGGKPLDHDTYQRGLDMPSAVLAVPYVRRAPPGAHGC